MSDVLVVIDVQQELVDALEPARREELLGTLVPLLDQARANGLPIVYVRHDGQPQELVPGTPGWEIPSAIAPRAGEPIVDKRHGNAFQETNLSEVLAGYEADHLIAAGMQTDFCVTKTITEAGRRGYRVTLVEDAHATYPSGGKSEGEIREAMHDDTRSWGGRIVPAAELFAQE